MKMKFTAKLFFFLLLFIEICAFLNDLMYGKFTYCIIIDIRSISFKRFRFQSRKPLSRVFL